MEQATQLDAPRVEEYWPVTHPRQTVETEEPVNVEYLPESHVLHTEAAASEYFPAGQLRQIFAAGDDHVPPGQEVQTDRSAAAAALPFVPAVQPMHEVDDCAPNLG